MNQHPQDLGNNAVNGSNVMVGFVVGAAVGAGIALLLAPASGAETRRRLGQTASRWGHGVKDGVEHARGRMSELKNDLGTAISAGRDAFAHEREAHAGHMPK
jgi:gas vesicle protein